MPSKKAPRPANSYRAARRNRCLRADPKTTWGPDWYIPHHRARYARGVPTYARTPGKYPLMMGYERARLTAYQKQVKSLWKAALAAFGAGRVALR